MKTPSATMAVAVFGGLACGQTCMWTPTSPTPPLPSPRSSAALAYDPGRGRIVLFGGETNGSPMPDTFEWNGAAWILRATTGPGGRSAAGMAYHPGLGKTILFGGVGQSGQTSRRTWAWDGTAWADFGTDSDLQPRIASMAWDAANARMLLIADSGGVSARMWEFNTVTNTWVGLNEGPPSVYWHAMAYDAARATMVVHNGTAGSASQWWEFSGAGPGVWIYRGEGPARRWGVGMAYDPIRSRTVLFGGWSSDSFDSLGETWECDGNTWVKRTEDGPGRRGGPAFVFDGSRVLSFGGTFAIYPVPAVQFNDVWRYDGTQSLGVIIAQGPAPQETLFGQPVMFTVIAPGATSFQWYRDNTPLSNTGTYSGVTTDTLRISAASTLDLATFIVRVSSGCGSASAGAELRLHDPLCYTNCDRSTALPILNANDFQCFLNQFAAGDSRANCDGSTTAPTLNANDFQCFLGRFAVGC